MSTRGYTFSTKLPVSVKEAIQNEYTFPPEASERKLSLPTWCMDCLCEGHCICHVDGMPSVPRPLHDIHIYPPGKVFYERKLDQTPIRSYWIIFDGTFPFLENLCQNSLGFMEIADPDRVLLDDFKETVTAATKGNSGYWRTIHVFTDMLDRLEGTLVRPSKNQQDYRFEIRKDRSRNLSLAERTRIFLEQNYRRKIRLDELARHLEISLSQLTHRYRQEAGESVIDTLNGIRLEQSIPLLQSGLKLKAVADGLGFANEFYYSRLFRQHFGRSPKQWLREHQQPDD